MSAALNAKVFTDYFEDSFYVEIYDIEKHHVKEVYLTVEPKDVYHEAAKRAAKIYFKEKKKETCSPFYQVLIKSIIDSARFAARLSCCR